MHITVSELSEQFSNQCSLIDRKFEMYDGKIDGMRGEMSKFFNDLETNHLAHLKVDIATNTTEIANLTKSVDSLLSRQWFLITTLVLALAGIVIDTYLNFR